MHSIGKASVQQTKQNKMREMISELKDMNGNYEEKRNQNKKSKSLRIHYTYKET